MPSPAWIAIGISILTLIVGTIVTLSVAALQRKQMRQIELHRLDPSVPLVPLPHPITQFFKNYAAFMVNVAMNLTFLTNALRQTGPITRFQVLSIAVFTGGLFTACIQELMRLWFRRISRDFNTDISRVIGILETFADIAVHEHKSRLGQLPTSPDFKSEKKLE
jgi:hypothetical protein